MKLISRSRPLLLAAAMLLFAAHVSLAQVNSGPKKRLRSPATVRGVIGGEAQARYVIRARKGQTMTVTISWRKEGDNTAGFSVGPASGDEQLQGQESNDGKRWSGRIPKTGDYIIYVTAHPLAHYTLRVVVK
jgi:hypothetical protein